MSALNVILMCGLGFGVLMMLVLLICCMFAPTEGELWPGEEKRRADAIDAERRKNFDPIARRQGLRIVRH